MLGHLLHCGQEHRGPARGVSVRAVPVTVNKGQRLPPNAWLRGTELGHLPPGLGTSFLQPFSTEQLAKLGSHRDWKPTSNINCVDKDESFSYLWGIYEFTYLSCQP